MRGFFDEDFCCREHREKYSSSFRKSWDQMPAHQYAVPEIAVVDGENAPIALRWAGSMSKGEARPPRVESDDSGPFVRVFQLVSTAAGETELNATCVAEFTPVNLGALDNIRGSVHSAGRIESSALIQLPQASGLPAAELIAESGLIFQIELPDMPAAPRWTGLPLAHFAPASQAAQRAEIELSTPSPSADAQPQAESACAETGSLIPAQATNRAFEPRLQLGLPVLAEASHGAALPLADGCELSLYCHSLKSHPAAVLQLAPVFPIELPGFAAAQEALEIESEDQAGAGQQISAEERQDELLIAGDLSPQAAAVHHEAIPEIAPPMAYYSSAVGATSLRSSEESGETTAALIAQPSALELPGFASILEPVAPAPAAQMATGAPLEPAPPDAAVPGADQDAGKPLRLTFGSLVRIKNWRLRITFARSA
ncbi:MAG: hypothetical protein DMG57_32840 [Acidobacteria bacterium]|nr:MAG: hypothetical protein DMG57_32840 [Acidobacteriota bacterium]